MCLSYLVRLETFFKAACWNLSSINEKISQLYCRSFNVFWFYLEASRMMEICQCLVKRESFLFQPLNLFNMLCVRLHMMRSGITKPTLCRTQTPVFPPLHPSLAFPVFSSPSRRTCLIKEKIFQIFHNSHTTGGYKVVSFSSHVWQRADCLVWSTQSLPSWGLWSGLTKALDAADLVGTSWSPVKRVGFSVGFVSWCFYLQLHLWWCVTNQEV